MQLIQKEHNTYVLSLARGEEMMAALLEWCKKEGIAGATLTGLGAADQLELAYYNLERKEYERHIIEEEVEILSLTGNLGELSGEKMFHIHGAFGRRDLSTFGGHVMSMRVSGACELHLQALSRPLARAFDEETGLNLLHP
jgi:predicted DNA-binding protein with PD1-like motif